MIARCTTQSWASKYLTKGKEYQVIRVAGENLVIIDDQGNERGYYSYRFEIIKPTQPTQQVEGEYEDQHFEQSF